LFNKWRKLIISRIIVREGSIKVSCFHKFLLNVNLQHSRKLYTFHLQWTKICSITTYLETCKS